MKAHTPSDGPRYHFSTDIPEFYEDTLLRIVPCNPHQRYVYWEIPAGIRNSCSFLMLKITLADHENDSDTDSSDTITEYRLDSRSTHHYITLSYPSLEYRYELLAVHHDSSRELICSSQPTPPTEQNSTQLPQEIVFRCSTAIAETTRAPISPHQAAAIENQPAVSTRKVPIIPSSWSAANSYSS